MLGPFSAFRKGNPARNVIRSLNGEGSNLGQAALEFALAAPFLIAFIMFIADVAFFGFNYISATNAVREGARCGAVGGSDAAIAARIAQTTGNLSSTYTVAPVSRTPVIGGVVTVSATFTYTFITPLNMLPGLNLGSKSFPKSATMRMETSDTTKSTC